MTTSRKITFFPYIWWFVTYFTCYVLFYTKLKNITKQKHKQIWSLAFRLYPFSIK
jgi:hypothetical protein